MTLEIKVFPGAKKELYKADGASVKVYLTVPPIDGRANAALIKFLCRHFSVRASSIEIIKGLKSRNKVINIVGL
ncbi:MAG: DUF167 domain-containing protein [Candidatus Omnitrophota bacterium]